MDLHEIVDQFLAHPFDARVRTLLSKHDCSYSGPLLAYVSTVWNIIEAVPVDDAPSTDAYHEFRLARLLKHPSADRILVNLAISALCLYTRSKWIYRSNRSDDGADAQKQLVGDKTIMRELYEIARLSFIDTITQQCSFVRYRPPTWRDDLVDVLTRSLRPHCMTYQKPSEFLKPLDDCLYALLQRLASVMWYDPYHGPQKAFSLYFSFSKDDPSWSCLLNAQHSSTLIGSMFKGYAANVYLALTKCPTFQEWLSGYTQRRSAH